MAEVRVDRALSIQFRRTAEGVGRVSVDCGEGVDCGEASFLIMERGRLQLELWLRGHKGGTATKILTLFPLIVARLDCARLASGISIVVPSHREFQCVGMSTLGGIT